MPQQRAIGIVRVSQTAGREGESFTSPTTQRERIEQECERLDFKLVEVFEEMDISGGKPLDARPGLRAAVAMVEAGEASVIVAAYFDRLFRSLRTQGEVIDRVETAGGQILAVDVGLVGSDTTAQWLNSTQHGMMAEWYRRSARDKTGPAQQSAIRRGVAPWPRITPGYQRIDVADPQYDSKGQIVRDGRLVVDPDLAPVVREAFELRASGATIADVRAHLAAHGVEVSWRGTQTFLQSRVVLGELHFGERFVDGKWIVGKYEANLTAWPAIVERELWQRVQGKMIAPRGPRGVSTRLLARLGVVRCAGCGGKMTVNRTRGTSWSYRCSAVPADCDVRASIKAELVEDAVVEVVRAKLADVQGRASVESGRRAAEIELEVAQAALDDAVTTFTAAGIDAETSVVAKLTALRVARDAARDRLEQLGPTPGATLTLAADRDWGQLTFDERRALIRATVIGVVISRGRGREKIVFGLYGDDDENARVLSRAARRVLDA